MLEPNVFWGPAIITTIKVDKRLKQSHGIFFAEIRSTIDPDSQCVESWRQILPQIAPNNLFQERKLLLQKSGGQGPYRLSGPYHTSFSMVSKMTRWNFETSKLLN